MSPGLYSTEGPFTVSELGSFSITSAQAYREDKVGQAAQGVCEIFVTGELQNLTRQGPRQPNPAVMLTLLCAGGRTW